MSTNAAPPFNALDAPWIPVRDFDGRVTEIGIRDALLGAHRYAGLADPSPLGPPTQLRLLLAVLHRVYSPQTEKDWLDLYNGGAGPFPATLLEEYFARWHDRFHLFGEKPLCQIGGDFKMKGDTFVAKMTPETDPSEYNRLFSHMHWDSPTTYSPAAALRMLLVAQTFALGGGISGNPIWHSAVAVRPNFAHGVTVPGAVLWLEGDTLFETLMLSLVPQSGSSSQDVPVWERDLTSSYFDRKTTDGLADRFTCLCRMVRLIPEIDVDGRTVVRRMYFTQGRALDKSAQTDPMQSYRQTKEFGLRPVLIGEDKATWRDLHALLQMDAAAGARAQALPFIGGLCAYGQIPSDRVLRLNVAGMSSDKAKVNLWRHDRVNLPAAFLEDEDLVARLGERLKQADEIAGTIGVRTRQLCTAFYAPVRGMMAPDRKNVDALAQQLDPRRIYWARLESRLPELLRFLVDDADAAAAFWDDCTSQAAEEAMETAVERLGPSPRAWRAAAAINTRFPKGVKA